MPLDIKWTEMKNIAQEDIVSLIDSEKSYGDSWKRRGGTGAFMMLARKFDIFKAGEKYDGDDGILDDIGDLRRYLYLVEHHIRFAIGEELSSYSEEENNADPSDPT